MIKYLRIINNSILLRHIKGKMRHVILNFFSVDLKQCYNRRSRFFLKVENLINFLPKLLNWRNFLQGSPTCYSSLILSLLILLPFFASAANEKLPIPRFASIKSNEVNARTGPTIKCPIEWVFVKKAEPIEIIAEYEQWRQIRDINQEGGWVHSSVLSGKRSVIILGNEIVFLLKYPELGNKVVAKVAPNTRCQLSKCKNDWCSINCQNYNGWVPKNTLWGVYKNEEV